MSHINGDVGGKGDDVFQRLFTLLIAMLFALIFLEITEDNQAKKKPPEEQQRIEKNGKKKEVAPKNKGIIMVVSDNSLAIISKA